MPLPETPGGTVHHRPELLHGHHAARSDPRRGRALQRVDLTASDELSGSARRCARSTTPTTTWSNGVWESNPFPLSSCRGLLRVDLAAVASARRRGQARPGTRAGRGLLPGESARRRASALVVSTNASDGQLSLSLYSPQSADGPLGITDAGAAPGTPVVEQNGPAGQPAQSGQDAGVPIEDQTLVDQTSVGRRRRRAGRSGARGRDGRLADARPRDERQPAAELVALLAARPVPRRGARGAVHAVDSSADGRPGNPGRERSRERGDQHGLPLRRAAVRRRVRRGRGQLACADRSSR